MGGNPMNPTGSTSNSKSQSSASASSTANKSFRVDDESSPYAFESEPEPLEIRPSVPPYRRKHPDITKQIHEPQKRENKPSVPSPSASASAMTQTSSNTTNTEISSKKSKLQGMSSQIVQFWRFF